MNRGKTLISLIVVLILLIGAVATVKLLIPEEETVEDSSITLFSMEPDTAVQLSWTYQNETVDLLKLEEIWFYVDDSSFPLDTSYIDAMLEALSEVVATRTLENVEDMAEYGLDEPVCTIELWTEETVTFEIGSISALGDSRYLSMGDGNVYLVDASILDSFEYGLYDIVQTDTIPTMSQVLGVTINAQGNKLNILYEEESGLAYSDEYVWYLNNDGEYLALDTELTESLVSEITELSWQECVEHNADRTALESYGLTMQGLTVSVSYLNSNGEEAVFDLVIGNASGLYCYAKLADSNMVYKIDGTVRDKLLYTTYHDLKPDEVLLMDWTSVDGMKIILEDATYEIVISYQENTDEDGNVTTTVTAVLDDAEIDVTGIENMLDALTSTGYSSGAAKGEALITFVFERSTETFPEVTLALYSYSSTECLVSLNGEATLFVDRESVDSLIQYVAGIVGA